MDAVRGWFVGASVKSQLFVQYLRNGFIPQAVVTSASAAACFSRWKIKFRIPPLLHRSSTTSEQSLSTCVLVLYSPVLSMIVCALCVQR